MIIIIINYLTYFSYLAISLFNLKTAVGNFESEAVPFLNTCVVHRWTPCHKDPARRSHVDRPIVLVKIDDKFVPIAEAGVMDAGIEV